MTKQTKKLKKTIICALFTAISVVIGTVCKEYLTFMGGSLRITFENLTIIMTGIFLGPFWGAAVGVSSDIITCITAHQPSISPIITLGAASVGLVSGFVSKLIKNKDNFTGLLICVFSAHIVGNMIIKTIGIIYYFGTKWQITLLRVPTYIAIAIIETVIIYTLLKQKYIKNQLEELK